MENLQKSMEPRDSKSGGPAEDSEDEDLDRLPRQSRQRALRENSVEIPITEQMLDDLENGEFWRGMQGARKRVRGILHTATGNKQES